VTQPTADGGPIEEAAALTALIEERRAELAELVSRRNRKLDAARTTRATVAAIARRVRLSPGRISQITNRRRGRQVGMGASGEANAHVQTAAPTPLATEVATA
jgi:hypothetical protein